MQMPINTSYQQNIDLIINNTTKNKDKMSEKTVIQPESSKSERKLKGLNDMMYNQLIKTDENPLETIQKDRKDSNLLNRQQEYRKKLASQGLKIKNDCKELLNDFNELFENTLTQKLDYELALSHEMTRKCSLLSYLIDVSVNGSKILELQDEINQISSDESKIDEDQIKKKITDMNNKLEEKIENLNKTIALSEIELNKSIKDIRKKNENDQKTREKNYRIQSNGSQKVLMKSSQNSSKSEEANEFDSVSREDLSKAKKLKERIRNLQSTKDTLSKKKDIYKSLEITLDNHFISPTRKINNLNIKISELNTELMKGANNLYKQYLIRNSKVEVDYYNTIFTNFQDVQMVEKSLIDQINHQISEIIGNDLKLYKDELDGQFELDLANWRISKLSLKLQEMEKQLKKINSFKLTRNLQKVVEEDKNKLIIKQKKNSDKMKKLIGKYKEMIQIENKSREKLIKKSKITKNKITEKINIVEKEKDGLSNEVKCLQDQKYIDAVISEESKEIKEKILEKIIKTSELKNESRLLDEEIYRAKVHLAKLHARNFPRLAFDYLK